MRKPRDNKFGWNRDSMPVVSQCMLCRHLDPKSPNAICTAFPGGIPPAILTNETDHRQPWIDPKTGQPGDRGIPLQDSITFEPKEHVVPEALDALNRYLDEHAD